MSSAYDEGHPSRDLHLALRQSSSTLITEYSGSESTDFRHHPLTKLGPIHANMKHKFRAVVIRARRDDSRVVLRFTERTF